MINRKFFYDTVRRSLFNGRITSGQLSGMESILNEWESGCHTDDRHLAYMLATAYHETDRTMAPIEEYGKGRGRKYGKRVKMNGRSYSDVTGVFYGRGFVQLTWYENYDKAGKKLGLNLLSNPELALQLPVATKILFTGMAEGWFTGKSLADYFSSTKEDWINARRIINGTDKASMIAGYAKAFYAAISHKG